MTNLKTENDSKQYFLISSSPPAEIGRVLEERGYTRRESDLFNKTVEDLIYRVVMSPNNLGKTQFKIVSLVGVEPYERFRGGSFISFQDVTLQGLATPEKRVSEKAFSELCSLVNDPRLGKVRVFDEHRDEYSLTVR